MKRRDFLKGVFATVIGVPLMKLAPYLPEPVEKKVISTVAKYRWQKYSHSITLHGSGKNYDIANLVMQKMAKAEQNMRDEAARAYFS